MKKINEFMCIAWKSFHVQHHTHAILWTKWGIKPRIQESKCTSHRHITSQWWDIHLFIQPSCSNYYVLDTGCIAKTKSERNPCPHEAHILVSEWQTINQINKQNIYIGLSAGDDTMKIIKQGKEIGRASLKWYGTLWIKTWKRWEGGPGWYPASRQRE